MCALMYAINSTMFMCIQTRGMCALMIFYERSYLSLL